MSWPFEIGRTYNRRRDIHDQFGGQRQSGIITPDGHPLVVLITGEGGEEHGYQDRLRDDGVFEYFGQGQVGDMIMTFGNSAIANHGANGESLLLFQALKDGALQYRGEWICQGYRTVRARDRNGAERNAFVFELRSLDAINEALDDDPAVRNKGLSLADLRRRAYSAAKEAVATGQAPRTIYERSEDVRDYVVARAAATCEGCTSPAPFVRPDGTPYLEAHHIRRVSDGGPDDPKFVIALCPTCHRRVHAGRDGTEYNAALKEKVRLIELRAD